MRFKQKIVRLQNPFVARLSDGSGAARFALKSIQSIALCGAVISALNSLIGGSIRTLRYGKGVQAIHSPVLSHYII